MIGFLDPNKSHSFSCEQKPRDGVDAEDNIAYNMSIEEFLQLDYDDNESKPKEPINSSSNNLIVDASFFDTNRDYRIFCQAENAENNAYGHIAKRYNTHEFPDKVGIRVSPGRGAPHKTIFEFVMIKPLNEALKCVFGYKNDVGEVLIEDVSWAGQHFSSQHQHLKTTLPSNDNGSNALHVFGRCTDTLGRSKEAGAIITIEGGDTVKFDEKTAD